jgi:hypothetical protein
MKYEAVLARYACQCKQSYYPCGCGCHSGSHCTIACVGGDHTHCLDRGPWCGGRYDREPAIQELIAAAEYAVGHPYEDAKARRLLRAALKAMGNKP